MPPPARRERRCNIVMTTNQDCLSLVTSWMHSSTRYNIGSNEPLLSQTFACPEPLSRRQQLLVTGASLPPSIVTPSPGYEKRHPRWEQTLDTHLGPRENSLDGAVGVVQTFQSSTTASPLVVAVVDRARHRYSTVLVTNRNLNSERSEIPSTWRRENEQPRRTNQTQPPLATHGAS